MKHRQRLRLKPEQRILALEVVRVRGRHRFLLGVIYRGTRWLDGVIFEPLGRKRTAGVAMIVKNSAYFKELRYIIIQPQISAPLDGKRLYDALGVPVISLKTSGRKRIRPLGWGLERQAVESLLAAFAVGKLRPDAVLVTGFVRTALERLF